MPHGVSPTASSALSTLSDLERTLLVVVAVACARYEPKHLGDVFQGVVMRLLSKKVTKAELSARLDELVEKRLLYPTEVHALGLGVRDDLLHAVLEAAHTRGELTLVAEQIRLSAPLSTEMWRMTSSDQSLRCARELRLGLYLGVDSKAQLIFKHCERQQASGISLTLIAYGLSLPPALLPVDGPYTHMYLTAAVAAAVDQLAPLGPTQAPWLMQWALEHRATLGDELRLRLCTVAVLRGDEPLAAALAPESRNTLGHCARMMCALAREDFVDAREAAKEAIESTRAKKSGRVKGVECDGAGIAALLLLTDSTPGSLQLAKAQLDSGRTHKAHPNVHFALTLFHAFVSGQEVPPGEAAHYDWAEHFSWLDLLFVGLSQRFRSLPLSKPIETALRARVDRAHTGGYAWLARVLEGILTAPANTGLLGLYAPEEPWQRTLRALEAAVSGGSTVEGEQSVERLVWVLRPIAEHAYEPIPRLQTRSAHTWSTGRQVALRRLLEAAPDTPYLGEHDRRVIKHIVVEREPARWGGGTTHAFDLRALLALVGHPLVFLEHEAKTPIEVVHGRARLEVEERDQTLQLSLSPAALARRTVVCVVENARRAVVYALEPAQLPVAHIFAAGGVSLPAIAKSALHSTLAKLAAHFPLASEIAVDAPHIEERTADGRVRVRLRRVSGGIGVRVCVLPLEAAPLFGPGEGSPRVIAAASKGGGAVCAVRDLAAEAHALVQLYAACPSLRDAAAAQHETTLATVEACLQLLCELRTVKDVLVEWPEGTPLTLSRELRMRDLSLRVRTAQDWLSAQGELAVDEQTKLSLLTLLDKSRNTQSRFIELDDGQFLVLSGELKKSLDTLDAMSHSAPDGLELHPLWLGLASLGEDFEHVRCDEKAKARLAQLKASSNLRPKLPKDFGAELRDYQREGYVWLCRLSHLGAGACLADDMGLGKTLQTLALLCAQAKHGPSLVVAPTSVCRNWIDEARRFAPGLRTHSLGSSERARTVQELGPHDVLICSYGLLQQEIETLSKKHFRVAVLDEAQAIKNPSTQRSRAASQLVADTRIALSGTPIENHIGELWSIMSFLNPGLLGSAKRFEERFAKPIARDSDPRAAQLLKRLIRPFILRRRKSEVLDDLPEKTVITLRIEPSEAERALYAALKEHALSRLNTSKQAGQARIQILAELTKLRRAACHPRLVAKDADIASSKLAAFEELLTELRDNGHRVLVFSQFIDHLSLVRERLDQLNVSYQYLDGSCSSAQRARSVEAFQAGQGDAFLISLKAGGSGLNLTAADYVVHLDPWWNPAVEEQASDRAHRIGQVRPVTIYRLVMQDSIEERILALHANKRELADALLEGSSRASTLSLADLLDLIQEGSEPSAKGEHAKPPRREHS